MISGILIANRGEIALRVIRTCKDMGIRSIAIFSEPDRLSPHVLLADEAYGIGPAASSESYLRMDAIIELALATGVDAIHPGYGFLSENETFARKVQQAGLIFIGPDPDTIHAMGSKTESRKTMIAAGVPVVPGAHGSVDSPEEARAVIAGIGGYPVLIKAASGGGGKGMRIVHRESDLDRALSAARGEAAKSFGDDTIYLEKYVQNPKHIEIQILADSHGNVVHLGERDCSIQRRHQKVIEEAPSPTLTPAQREHLGSIAVQAARACKYVNAGTVEFIFDNKDSFFFLEVNTRLQVEHPVTEMVLGLDLVRLQIEIAAGQKLPFSQEELQPQGHAIECRINAENVFAGFVPSTGKLQGLRFPAGPGVRVDASVFEHSEITPHYDPMIAKLITHAATREAAIARMKRALAEFYIRGIDTTIPFCQRVMDHPDFISGNFTTAFVESYWEAMLQAEAPAGINQEALAIAVSHDMHQQPVSAAPELAGTRGASAWKSRITGGWKNK